MTGVLAAFEHPTLKNNLTALKAIHHCALLDDVLHIELTMPFARQSGFEALQASVGPELLRVTGASAIDWKLKHDITTLKRANGGPASKACATSSPSAPAKAGWGNPALPSTRALALAAEGQSRYSDADIYGPSIPNMLGTEHERPTSPDGQHMAPIVAHGPATNSIGYPGDRR